ncbi:hypothetical protein Patl1_23349 [Pistacia atlantica]|uniref:Uncharacterized protein n=1 Tax=Pistacia atlantica TaxID=434234 RepID=A0ACC0ZYU4_9ROSI|nr:hypothetical protein Patl1_23349 [Pistacia atlantica]
MRWLQSLLAPWKKLWFRKHSPQRKSINLTLHPLMPAFLSSDRGIYILYEDVKSCQCEDVHVLWSILVESNTPSMSLQP